MTVKLRQSQWAKAERESWWLSLAKKLQSFSFFLFIFLLPTQLGKHFWFDFSYVLGSRVDYLSPTLYITDVLLLLLFLTVILQKKIFVSPYYSLVVLFLSLNVFLSRSPLIGWYGILKFVELSFLAWYVAHLPLSFKRLGLLFAVGVFLESLLSFFQIIHQGSLGGVFYFLGERAFNSMTPGIANASVAGELVLRPYATFSHPNMLAGYLVIAMLLTVYFLGTKDTIARVAVFASLVFGTAALTMSLSRVGIVSWLVVGLLAVFVTYRQRTSKIFLFGCIAVLVVILFSFLFFPASLLRIFSLSLGESFSQRAQLAANALSLTSHSPIFGIGLNNFIPSLPFVAKQGVILQPVHSIYLLIAAEMGLVGFTVVCFSLYILAKKLLHLWTMGEVEEKNKVLLLLLALFVILFSGLFDHYFLTLQQGQLLFALVIGLCLREVSSFDTIRE